MPLRDFLLFSIVFGLTPICFLRPWVGFLLWSWLGYMNPHRYAWGPAYDFPFAQVVAIATLAGTPFARDRKPIPWNRETILLLALWAWFTVTTIVALYPTSAWSVWQRTSKILLMTFISLMFFQSLSRLRTLLLVVALSISFYGVKGGFFVLSSGGTHSVWGPPGDTFVSSNNALALALNMSLPFLWYLAKTEPRRPFRLLLYTAFLGSALSVPFTYSRGGIVGLAAVLFLLAASARRRILFLLVTALSAFLFATSAPEKWLARVGTIIDYQQDASALGRLTAWGLALRIAGDRPIAGGGFSVFSQIETWATYLPDLAEPRFLGLDAHSVYFNLLGEHGYVGLVLFLLLTGSALHSLHRLRIEAKSAPGRAWLAGYANMLRASFIAYLVTGAFLSVAYSDFVYSLFTFTILLKGQSARPPVRRGLPPSALHTPLKSAPGEAIAPRSRPDLAVAQSCLRVGAEPPTLARRVRS